MFKYELNLIKKIYFLFYNQNPKNLFQRKNYSLLNKNKAMKFLIEKDGVF